MEATIFRCMNLEHRLQYALKGIQYVLKIISDAEITPGLIRFCNINVVKCVGLRKILRLFESLSVLSRICKYKRVSLLAIDKIIILLFNLCDHILMFKEKVAIPSRKS